MIYPTIQHGVRSTLSRFRKIISLSLMIFVFGSGRLLAYDPPAHSFIPGSGGSVPDLPQLEGVAGQISGLWVESVSRQNIPLVGGTKPRLHLRFPSPETYDADGYQLLYSINGANWEPYLSGGEPVETSSVDSNNFVINPVGSYYYRLLVLEGPHDEEVSNIVHAPLSSVETRFTGWGLDESYWVSGVMWPWVGRGLEASFAVTKLSDSTSVTNGMSYQWYRVNPYSFEMTAIPGETNLTYITTTNDLGGYHFICRATGDEELVGGYAQIYSHDGVWMPNMSFASDFNEDGFRLNLHKRVPSLSTNDLSLGYYDQHDDWNWVELDITDVTHVESNAVFDIAVEIPTGIRELYLENISHVWLLASTDYYGHGMMEGLEIHVPLPHFRVDPSSSNVNIWGHEWPAGAEVNIKIGDINDPDFETDVFVDAWGDWGLWSDEYVVEAGDLITVSDGETTISNYEVTNLTVTNINLEADTISGTAEPFSWVRVSVDNASSAEPWMYGGRYVQADETGNWIADFSEADEGDEYGWGQALDLDIGVRGHATQEPEDIDIPYGSTHIHIEVQMPVFTVVRQDNGIWGEYWYEDETVNVIIGDPEYPHFADTAVVDAWGEWRIHNIDYDIMTGDTVTVTSDSITKEHIVTALQVTNINVDANTISGISSPYAEVMVFIWDDHDSPHRVTWADENGEWIADFSYPDGPGKYHAAYDLHPGSHGCAVEEDDDGDQTFIVWPEPPPWFSVEPQNNSLWGQDWPSGETVTVKIGDPDAPDFEDTAEVDAWGEWELWHIDYDIMGGATVTVSTASITKEHIVTGLQITEVDVENDKISGFAAPYAYIQVYVWDDDHVERRVWADENGEWVADFSEPDGPEHWYRAYDIQAGSEGSAEEQDDDWDRTVVVWRISNPVFEVDPRSNQVRGRYWPAYEQLEIKIGFDLETPTYTTTVWTDTYGYWWAHDIPINITDGMHIRVTCENIEKEHTVYDLGWFPVVDGDNDTVSGTAPPGVYVVVRIHDHWHIYREAVADGSGNWSVDFSTAEGEQQIFDIVEGTNGQVSIEDEDGDSTFIPWRYEDVEEEILVGWFHGEDDEEDLFIFEVEIIAKGIMGARVKTPSNVWYNLEVYDFGYEWRFEQLDADLTSLEEHFPEGVYELEVTRADGVSTYAIDTSGVEWPPTKPNILTPERGAENVPVPDELLTWEEPTDTDFDFIFIDVHNPIDDSEIWAFIEDTTTTSFLMTNLTANQPYDIFLGFGNMKETNTTPDNIHVEILRGKWDDSYFTTGSGDDEPQISVTPASLYFGTIEIDTTEDLPFTVENTGTGVLSGEATVSVPFSILSGGTYSLSEGQSQAVTVRYSPTGAATHNAQVTFTGGGGATRPVSGIGIDPSRIGPNWWYDFEVLVPDAAVTNDYAAANAGQLKHIASMARDAMESSLPGGAGTAVNGMVNSFSNTYNYVVVNLGQAKNVAEPFYDRLIEEGRAEQYPWVGAATTNDHAVINIGQLKNLFDFDL